MTQRRILAIHAHPDDESSKGAATMARYADEGNRVMVLTCTGGERGDVLNPALIDTPGVKENIKAIRAEEMAAAVAALGVEHKWLGYVDSGLPQGDPLPPLPKGSFALADTDEVTQKVVQVIRQFRPEVIITYDENGGYPHPDHLKVHEVSMLAWDLAGDPAYHPEFGEPWEPLKLYYTHGFIRQRLQLFHDLLIKEGKISPYGDILQRWKAVPLIIAQIFEIIQKIRSEGVTVFLVEQNANRALQLADRGYVLENGRIVLEDSGQNLLANDDIRKAYLGV